MRITPIDPAAPAGDPPPRARAFMVVHHKKHIVVDAHTGERFELEPGAAWELHEKLNLTV